MLFMPCCSCHPWRGASGFDWPRPCHPWQGVQAFKSCAFDRLRRPAFTHPWRGASGFDWPRPCHPWQGVQAFKSCAFDRLRRPAFTHPWRGASGFDWPRPCHPWQGVQAFKSCAFDRLRRPAFTHPWRGASGFDWPRPCHPWQGVQAFKSCAFDRLRRPAFTHPWRGASGFDWPRSRHPVEPFVRPPSTARWRSVCARSCASQTLALAPRKAMLFVCCADRATCILAYCACHPWRGASGFDWPRSRHPVEPFGPRKAMLFVCCADRGLTLCLARPLNSTQPKRRLTLCSPSVFTPRAERRKSGPSLGSSPRLRYFGAGNYNRAAGTRQNGGQAVKLLCGA